MGLGSKPDTEGYSILYIVVRQRNERRVPTAGLISLLHGRFLDWQTPIGRIMSAEDARAAGCISIIEPLRLRIGGWDGTCHHSSVAKAPPGFWQLVNKPEGGGSILHAAMASISVHPTARWYTL